MPRGGARAGGLGFLGSSKPPNPCTQVAAAGAFAQTLRRYTSLNHLAQAARAVLQNTAQINQMLSDLNRVDFANVQVSAGRANEGQPRGAGQAGVTAAEPRAPAHPVCPRSRPRGCAVARTAWCSGWSRTSR